MPQAAYQGIINIPLFQAPYLVGVNMTTAGFDPISDWATVNVRRAYIPNTAPNGYYGLYFKKVKLTPFGMYTDTNNNAGTLGTTTTTIYLYSSVNGNLYGLFGGFSGTTKNQAICLQSWAFQNKDYSNNLWTPTRYAAVNYSGTRTQGIAGLANFVPFQDYCGYTIQIGAIQLQLARPDAFVMYQDRPYGGAARGFTTQQFLSQPDQDLVSTHFLNLQNSSPSLYHTWSIIDPIIPPVTYDDSIVTIDGALGSAFQTYWNQTTSTQFRSVSKGPNSWLVIMANGLNPTPDNTVFMLDISCRKYWKLNIVPYTIALTPGTVWNNSMVADAKLDPTGVLYVASGNFVNSSTGQIAHSYGANLAWFPIPLNGQVPAFQLPCPPLCDSSQGILSF